MPEPARGSAVLLQCSQQESKLGVPFLQSGIYLLLKARKGRDGTSTTPAREGYVVYWPEDTTWTDAADSAVARNRVTMLR